MYEELVEIGKKLENHYNDVQDIEFTIQRGKVWMLQTRNAKRTGFAAVRIAVDLVNEGLITPEEALSAKRIPADDHPTACSRSSTDTKRRQGQAGRWPRASTPVPGAASGKIVFHAGRSRKALSAEPERLSSFWCAARPRPKTSAA